MSVRRDIVANYLGQGWTALMGFAFLPQYVRLLGIESYGLIGFFTVLQGWMLLFDFGITPTINREMARLAAGLHTPASIRDLLRTLECVYAAVIAVLIGLLWLGAPWIAREWLSGNALGPETITAALRLMTFVLASRLIEQLYRAALMGLQDQVWVNGVQSVLATLRSGGALLILVFVDRSVAAFFLWQGLMSVLGVAALGWRMYARIPPLERTARLDWSALAAVRRFAGGMFAIALLSALLMYGDKLLVSKLLPLQDFGYYMLATAVANGLLQLVMPMHTAMLPRLTTLAAAGDNAALGRLYVQACQWVAALLVPPAALLVFQAVPVLAVWNGSDSLSGPVAPLVTLMALGTLCNGLMVMPYTLQVAHAWTSLTVRVNVVAVVLLGPLVYLAIPRFGAAGAAMAWFGLNAAYLVIVVPLMHRRVLPESRGPWYRHALLAPVMAAGACGVVMRLILPEVQPLAGKAGLLVLALGVYAIAVAISLPEVRRAVFSYLRGTPPSPQPSPPVGGRGSNSAE